MMNLWSPIVLLVLACVLAEAAEAKRGCALYGHSCYGGMGKRTPEYFSNGENNGQPRNEGPSLVFTEPKSEFAPLQKLTTQQYNSLSQLIKQWILSYRKAQEDMRENNI